VVFAVLIIAVFLLAGCGEVTPTSSNVVLRLEVLGRNTYSADVRLVYANYSSEIFYANQVSIEACFAGSQCFSVSVPAYSDPLYPGEVRSVTETFYLVDPIYGQLESLELTVEGYFPSGKHITLSSGKTYL
jgi:hypothetical protein